MAKIVLLLVALEQELPPRLVPQEMKVVYTGVGKINSAIAATRAICDLRPHAVINFGTAGAVRQLDHGIYKIKSVIQRDLIAAPLAERGVTPFDISPNSYSSTNGEMKCATGDSFVTTYDPWLHEMQIDLVDMELFAIAKVACAFNISWSAYKFISDEANANSVNDWQSQINLGQTQFLEKLKSII